MMPSYTTKAHNNKSYTVLTSASFKVNKAEIWNVIEECITVIEAFE